jgi:hypothetical protein
MTYQRHATLEETLSDPFLLTQGFMLDDNVLTDLELALERCPENPRIRLLLIGKFICRHRKFQPYFEHVLWMIRNHPWELDPQEGGLWFTVGGYCPTKYFTDAREEWLGQLERFPTDARLVGNAGTFLS